LLSLDPALVELKVPLKELNAPLAEYNPETFSLSLTGY